MDDNLKAITDGRFYGINDMVRVGCHDCQGCSDCCQGMGQSILLDPFDCNLLSKNLGKSFQELLAGPLELHVEEGLVLPNIKMIGEPGKERCSFLDQEGRCSIHGFRPGICRLFPLGRNYREDGLDYFLLVDACPAKNKSKMKVGKWLDRPNQKEYEEFLIQWHKLTKKVRQQVLDNLAENPEKSNALTMEFLQYFYMVPYGAEFFAEFAKRCQEYPLG